MSQNYQSPKERQVTHMKRLLSLEGSLLTDEQKRDILQVTKDHNIIEGFERIDYWKNINHNPKAVTKS